MPAACSIMDRSYRSVRPLRLQEASLSSAWEETQIWKTAAGVVAFLGGAVTLGQFLHLYNAHPSPAALAMAAIGGCVLLLVPLTQRRPVAAGWMLMILGTAASLGGLHASEYSWAGGASIAAGGILCFIWQRESLRIPVDTTSSTLRSISESQSEGTSMSGETELYWEEECDADDEADSDHRKD
jgi:hypothetical protein